MACAPGAPPRRGSAVTRLARRLPRRAGADTALDHLPAPARPRCRRAVVFDSDSTADGTRRDHRVPGDRAGGAGGRRGVRPRRPVRPTAARRRLGPGRPRGGGVAVGGPSARRAVSRTSAGRRPAAPRRPGVHVRVRLRAPARRGDRAGAAAALPGDGVVLGDATSSHDRGHRPHRRLPRHRAVHRRRRSVHRVHRVDRRDPRGTRCPRRLTAAGSGLLTTELRDYPRSQRLLDAARRRIA